MKLKTRWELEKLFYKDLKDPRIYKDIERGDRAIDAFAKKYTKNKRWHTDPKALKKALSDYEALERSCTAKPLYYANYRKELDAKDKEAEAFLNKWGDHYTKRGTKLLFFELELGKVSASAQKKFLAADELRDFRYWLERFFEKAKHDLSESEEKILSLLSDVSFGRWVQAVDNILNTREVAFKGKRLPLNEALARVSHLPLKDRRALHAVAMQALKESSPMAESELNAIVSRKKITDELRGFKEPYDATILGYENDKESVLNLVRTVTEHFEIPRRFYTLKTRMLKQKSLTYADRAASVGVVGKKIRFAQAVKIVHDAFYALHPRYADIFDRLLANGQVDVFPRAGKTSGAYCSGGVDEPTMLLLNHVENAHSLLTLAHEMGHAIHTERSKTQRPLYQRYTTSTAEVASTFFEQVAFEALTRTLSGKERLVAMHDKLQDDVATIFRQIAFFNFELDLHRRIREKGMLPKEAIAELLNEHTRRYMGSAIKLAPDDGYFFVTVSHFRRFFYVYSYAFGQLVSRALYERVRQDPAFIKKIDAFLCAGGSDSPEGIFAACGLDLYTPDIFLEGLRGIERDLAELEKAVAKGR
jgi:oligoendopeptidase F